MIEPPRDCYQRATALLTNPNRELLVFDHVGHPRPGGEDPEPATFREMQEESGISTPRVVRKLGEAWQMALVGQVPRGIRGAS